MWLGLGLLRGHLSSLYFVSASIFQEMLCDQTVCREQFHIQKTPCKAFRLDNWRLERHPCAVMGIKIPKSTSLL